MSDPEVSLDPLLALAPPPPADLLELAEREAERVAGTRRGRLRRRLLSAGAAGVACVGIAFTAPGQAATRWIADVAGIGDPASVPGKEFGDMIERDPSIVLASGIAPDGSPYEIAVSRAVFPENPNGPGDAGGQETCMTVDIPAHPSFQTVEFCSGDSYRDLLSKGTVDGVNYADGAGVMGSEARYVFSAILSENIDRVDLTYVNDDGDRVSAQTDVGTVDESIRQQIDTNDHVGYMVGFVPDDGLGSFTSADGSRPGPRSAPGVLGTVLLTGYDSAGRVVDTYDFGSQFTRQTRNLATDEDASDEGPRMATGDLAVSALICQAFGAEKAANISWCDVALKALETRPEVAEVAARGGYDVNVDGDTVTVRAPNGEETISTYDP